MNENTRSKLEALQPKSKAARLRGLMPVIERKLAEGVGAAQIAEALTQEGLSLTPEMLRNYVYRYRKKGAGRVEGAQAGPQQPAPEASPAEQQAASGEDDARPKGVWRRPQTSAEELQGYRDLIRNRELAAMEERTRKQIARRKAETPHGAVMPDGKKGDSE